MKKAIVALAIAAFASTATATIQHSKHDLNKTGVGYQGNLPLVGSCQFCHAPHFANTTGGYVQIPLWNRQSPSTATYHLYTTAASMNPQLGSGSFTCLSCHDGTSDIGLLYTGRGFAASVALGSYAAADYANLAKVKTSPTTYGDGPLGGVDLRDDHPVGVVYTGAGDFKTVAEVVASPLKLYANEFGAGATVECGSCHDPHRTESGAPVSFLRIMPSQNIDLCAVCHSK